MNTTTSSVSPSTAPTAPTAPTSVSCGDWSDDRMTGAVRRARSDLETHGFAVVPGVLAPDLVARLLTLFHRWFESTPGLAESHRRTSSHGIIKHHYVGHADFMWLMRVRVAPFWRALYGGGWRGGNATNTVMGAATKSKNNRRTTEVVTSFDGCCYMPSDFAGRDRCWCHTDQRAVDAGFRYAQGLVALTANTERTLVVWPGSHRLHREHGAALPATERRKWFRRVPEAYLETLARDHGIRATPVSVSPGDLVLWDSRTLHQNRYGRPRSAEKELEKRVALYTCMLPRRSPRNTPSQDRKRDEYRKKYRSTSHSPYPIRVNSMQPNTRGDARLKIDYSVIKPPVQQVVQEAEINRLI